MSESKSVVVVTRSGPGGTPKSVSEPMTKTEATAAAKAAGGDAYVLPKYLSAGVQSVIDRQNR